MKQVRDPMGSDEWTDCDGETDEDDVPRKIEVRVIPMHFRVGRGR